MSILLKISSFHILYPVDVENKFFLIFKNITVVVLNVKYPSQGLCLKM